MFKAGKIVALTNHGLWTYVSLLVERLSGLTAYQYTVCWIEISAFYQVKGAVCRSAILLTYIMLFIGWLYIVVAVRIVLEQRDTSATTTKVLRMLVRCVQDAGAMCARWRP